MTSPTSTPIIAGQVASLVIDPWDRYVPVPPNGQRCTVSGLGHARLYQLLLHEAAGRSIRIVRLRQPGATRGLLLYHVGDLKKYLEQLAAQTPRTK